MKMIQLLNCGGGMGIVIVIVRIRGKRIKSIWVRVLSSRRIRIDNCKYRIMHCYAHYVT